MKEGRKKVSRSQLSLLLEIGKKYTSRIGLPQLLHSAIDSELVQLSEAQQQQFDHDLQDGLTQENSNLDGENTDSVIEQKKLEAFGRELTSDEDDYIFTYLVATQRLRQFYRMSVGDDEQEKLEWMMGRLFAAWIMRSVTFRLKYGEKDADRHYLEFLQQPGSRGDEARIASEVLKAYGLISVLQRKIPHIEYLEAQFEESVRRSRE